MSEAFRCQCSRWSASRPCEHRMTQEDLLCDPCRDGCSLITIGDGESWHVQMTDFKYQLTG
jgi:hypothetical protein